MTNKPLLRPTNDFVFKKIFAEHDRVLIGFLQSVLDIAQEEYSGLKIVDPHILREAVEDKESILDVKIKLRDGRDIDVEIQVKPQPTIWKRMQYYTAGMYVKQLEKGNKYHLLTNAITILITDFILVKDDDRPHHRFRFYDEGAGLLLPDSIEIHTLEIRKRRANDKADLGHWLAFFAAKTPEDFMTASAHNPAIAEAYGIIKTLSADEQTRLLAESREKGRRDYEDRMDGAWREGMEKGMEKGRLEGMLEGEAKGVRKGRNEGRLEVAREALAVGLPAETIAKFTGLSVEEIQNLQNS